VLARDVDNRRGECHRVRGVFEHRLARHLDLMEPELTRLAVQTVRNGACDHMDLVAALSQSGCQGQRNDPAASQGRKAHDSDAQARHQHTPSKACASENPLCRKCATGSTSPRAFGARNGSPWLTPIMLP